MPSTTSTSTKTASTSTASRSALPLVRETKGKAHYRKYLELEVEFDDEKQNAWVLVDHLKNGEKLAEGVMEMFWDAAGFCSEKDYDKWFCEKED